MNDVADRRHGALIGLASGDAAGWPSRRHRSLVLPAWTRRLGRELDAFAEAEEITTLPVPFALNQDPAPLRFGPSDDAEWVAWTMAWLSHGSPASAQEVHARWIGAAAAGSVPRGRISVATAVDALRRGVRPPVTGRHNSHHFDDAAAVRAVGVGAVVADPDEAVTIAGWDAEVTNAEDGVAAARAVARVIAAVVGGTAGLSDVAPLVLADLPADGLAGRTVRAALAMVSDLHSPAAAVPLLDDLDQHVYSYGVAAASTLAVAVAFADVAGRGDAAPIDAITSAACLPALADSAPALTGALVGAAHGLTAFPEPWVRRCRRLAGCCLPALAGVDLLDLAEPGSTHTFTTLDLTERDSRDQ